MYDVIHNDDVYNDEIQERLLKDKTTDHLMYKRDDVIITMMRYKRDC